MVSKGTAKGFEILCENEMHKVRGSTLKPTKPKSKPKDLYDEEGE